MKRKWSEGTTINALPLATSSTPQWCGLFSCTLPMALIIPPAPLCRTKYSSARRNAEIGFVVKASYLVSLLEELSSPQNGTLGRAGHLSPASVSFPQEDEPVLPPGLGSLWRNEAFAQHDSALTGVWHPASVCTHGPLCKSEASCEAFCLVATGG